MTGGSGIAYAPGATGTGKRFAGVRVATLSASAQQKLAEFQLLQYPRGLLRMACTTMAVHTRNTVWFRVRDKM